MEQLLRLLVAFTVAYLACVLIPRQALAQTAQAGGLTYMLATPAGVIPTEVLGLFSPIPQRPLPTLPTPTGVAASSTALVPVSVGPRTVPVPVTATAQISRVAIARAAVKLIPYVGVALAVKELYDLLSPLGYSVTPSGQLQSMPKPGVFGDAPGTGYQYYAILKTEGVYVSGRTPTEACSRLSTYYLQAFPEYLPTRTLEYAVVENNACSVTWVEKVCNGTCLRHSSGHSLQKLTNFYTPQLGPADPEATLADAISILSSSPIRTQRLYDALQNDWKANPSLPSEANPINQSTPVQITAPQVTTPEKIIRTEVIQRPDGSTDTVTTKEKTTVTPVTTGSTMGDVATTYHYNTTTTTTTTNNVTNVTTSSTVSETGEIASSGAQGEPTEDQCKANPNRAGCAEIGTPPTAEDLPKEEVPFSFNPMSFASAAGCPAPVAFYAYGAREISFQPLCDVMAQMRPIFLACAALATALIFLRGLRQL